MLTKQLYRANAMALKGLCMVHGGPKAFPEACKAIEEALAIMEVQQDEQYGSMLVVSVGWTGAVQGSAGDL